MQFYIKILSTFCVLFLSLATHAQKINGIILSTDSDEPLPFTHVYIPDSPYGSFADEEGKYDLQLPAGSYQVYYSILGYKTMVVDLKVKKDTLLNIYLDNEGISLSEVVVSAKKENLGKQIIKKVIDKKKTLKEFPDKYIADRYFKTLIISNNPPEDSNRVSKSDFFPVYMNENNARLFVNGTKSKLEISSELKLTSDNGLARATMMDVDRRFMSQQTMVTYNPLDIFSKVGSVKELDIYKNQINNGSLSDRPISSPIGPAAFANYRFRLTDLELLENGDTLFTVKISPIFKQAPLFEGYVKVNSSSWLITTANLMINPNALPLLSRFAIRLEYSMIADNIWIPTETDIDFEAKMGENIYKGNTTVIQSDFNTEPIFRQNFFNRELVRYLPEALEKDSLSYSGKRPAPLTDDEIYFIKARDSISRKLTDPEYLREQDSIYNRITPLDVLVYGVGIRRRSIGLSYYINSLLESIQPLGVGGYRQRLGGSVTKEFSNNNELDLGLGISYGFNNNDLKGSARLSYMYLPLKFARVYGGFKDRYDLITINQSISAILSRSNFVRVRGWNLGHRMEIWNGIYLDAEVEYEHKNSIDDLVLSDWSEFLFGELNEPLPFEEYNGFILNLDLVIIFDQKYITRGRKKIVLGSDFPTLKIQYKKGIPGILKSEINFDQIDLSLAHRPPATKFGSMNWELKAGAFLNQKSLRFIEYKYFRGSDPYIFTSPLENFQLLGPTLSTPNAFYQGNIIHHFDGFIMDKIPWINKLQLEIIAGAGSLAIPNQDFIHGEVFAGLGKKFKLWGEIVQIAAYAITADNTIDKLNVEYKIGMNFYNAFTGSWIY
jgi:hypothetical protein